MSHDALTALGIFGACLGVGYLLIEFVLGGRR